jgi:hypothetical protein
MKFVMKLTINEKKINFPELLVDFSQYSDLWLENLLLKFP